MDKAEVEAPEAKAQVVRAQAGAAVNLVKAAQSPSARAEAAPTLADWSQNQAETAQALADKLTG
ncbi:hypothetical protein KXD40_002669 [Peronospora effusa]|uniref:Uncharacterized protein n=1 Tax=Peronospora effusa TaxID=542832 RepID=A0A3M6VA06_9STRA|nr:hypothetical protein DD238_007681 [Peronospora effusa]RQM11456.1 hypothetical protein DD237_007917 [Peronospora effusa]UIZ29557.1 hypothetical protein KXD40_002669 [Peronospora effusa]